MSCIKRDRKHFNYFDICSTRGQTMPLKTQRGSVETISMQLACELLFNEGSLEMGGQTTDILPTKTPNINAYFASTV